jgi:hypothetical protein
MNIHLKIVSIIIISTVVFSCLALLGDGFVTIIIPKFCHTTDVFGQPEQICDLNTQSWQWVTGQVLIYLWFLVPFLGTIVAAIKMNKAQGVKNKFLYFLAPIIISVLLTLIEIIIYKPWVHYQTPAGSSYTRYGLDSFYPMLGIFLLIAYVFTVVLSWGTYSFRFKKEKPTFKIFI